jgi:zinc/manganese transport system permease protein
MGPALAACLVLAGIHAYLGLHVIEREVIFVDLALAQIAALGTASSVLFGIDFEHPASWWLSLSFTLAGATIFALTRFRKQRVPQEAVIGIAYIVAAALLVLVLGFSAEGDEHIRHALTGNILLVRPQEVLKVAALYGAVGIFHFIHRERFLFITREPEAAFDRGLNVRWWDFLFYATFGIVVTSSVKIAGVLLVFTFLVVPASCAVLFAESVRGRLAWGWAVGFTVSALGIAASYFLDLPTGATVVCTFGLALVVLAVARRLLPRI